MIHLIDTSTGSSRIRYWGNAPIHETSLGMGTARIVAGRRVDSKARMHREYTIIGPEDMDL